MQQRPVRSITILVVVAALATLGSVQAAAQAPDSGTTPLEALDRLFSSEAIDPSWFSPLLLEQVSLAQLEFIIAQISTGLGEYQGVSESGQQFLVLFENGDVPTIITLDAQGRIVGLFFQPPRLRVTGLTDAVAAFEELPGEVSVVVYSPSGELAAINPDKPLAVGSAAKLAILAALEHQIQAGARSWDDVVLLEEDWKSLPSGVLQQWPAGSPLTLHTLATQMISISDNTATDGLIRILGREAIEPYSPRNIPFLTTRETFTLKDPANAEFLERYRAADPQGRLAILEEIKDLPVPDVSLFTSDPVAIDIEWYLTTRELCGLMSLVRHLDLMSINPGVASADDWEKVSYKGGSEPGVLNLTTWLDTADGGFYCVSATWNNPEAPLDELKFFTLYSTLVEELKKLN